MLTLYENLMRGNQLCHWWIASVRDFDPSKGFPSEPKASIRKPPGLWTEGGLKHQVAASAERVPELVKPMLKMSFLTEIAKIKPIEWVHPAMPSYRKETFFFFDFTEIQDSNSNTTSSIGAGHPPIRCHETMLGNSTFCLIEYPFLPVNMYQNSIFVDRFRRFWLTRSPFLLSEESNFWC